MMIHAGSRAGSLLVACVLLAAPSRAGVLVVDAAGGGDFTKLPEAVAAAVDGDILLVRAGDYVGYISAPLGARSLTLLADASAGMPLVEQPSFHGLEAGHTLIVRGFRLNFEFAYGIELVGCAGAVVVEDCELRGGHEALGNYPGWPGARVKDCSSVTFARCSLTGGDGIDAFIDQGAPLQWGPGSGGRGADVSNSHVAFHACVLLAGKGGYNLGTSVWGANGGSGLALLTSTALFSGSVAQGGPGGTGCWAAMMPAYCSGGQGILLDATSTVQVLDSSWVGGVAGTGLGGLPGQPGAAFEGPSGQPVVFSGSARTLAVSSPVREQQPGLLELDGVAGDFVLFFTSFDAGSLPLPGKKGWLALAPPFFGPFALGAISDPGGQLDIPFTAPDLTPPSLEGRTFLLQGVFLGAGGTVLGSVGSFTLVDGTL